MSAAFQKHRVSAAARGVVAVPEVLVEDDGVVLVMAVVRAEIIN